MKSRNGQHLIFFIVNSIKALLTFHSYKFGEDVYIFSSPRSGSTWLMELIMTQDEFRVISEPFDLRKPEIRKSLQINKWETLYSTASLLRIESYFRFLSGGSFKNKLQFPFETQFYRFRTKRSVFQILHALEDQMNWVKMKFGGRIVYLLRHPIAVSLSRKILPRLNAFLTSDFISHFDPAQIQFAKKVIASGSKLEKAVLSWSLQNSVALQNRQPDWLVVTYEQLVVQPDSVIDLLADRLHLPDSNLLKLRLQVPSGSSGQSEKETREVLSKKREEQDKLWLIRRWKEKVDPGTEEKLMEVPARFGIDVYSAGKVMPDEKYIIKK